MYEVYAIKYGPNIPSGSMASGSSRTSKDPVVNLFNTLRNETAKRQRGNTPSSELGRYSGTDFISTMSAEEYMKFDILAWWKGKESQFPILSAMARDLLTVQASTVASESAFSLSGRVLSLRRTRLTPTSVEMCICLKDHLDAVDRIQDSTNLEDEIIIEPQVHEEEVAEGLSSGLSDEELAYDASIRLNNSSGEDEM
ncbi:hypothetical protein E3N88_42542 [Mikania micrantha]|uniref:HAT C-terminal dimerisation domain-containing protein n=1 Tax=Mikania micrantha TaxID=192012 RepID=A0A5N6LHG5_9ASTR|nr:hypothetical protein E3N88_42542 [Mikania micrantha]